jgi:transposase-like protein
MMRRSACRGGTWRQVLDLIEAGRPVAEIAAQLGVSDQTIYNWRNQDQIDRGLRAGVSTTESADLTAARKRPRAGDRTGGDDGANELLKAQTDPKVLGGRRAES